jgi:SAM-dependent methyltransferase
MDNDLDRVRASWEQRAVESGASLSGVLLRNLSENANRTLDEWHATILRDALLPEVRTGARVLDLGCGYGRLSRVIASARPDIDVVGQDLSLTYCRRYLSSAGPCVVADVALSPFTGASFDALLSVTCLMYVPRENRVPPRRVPGTRRECRPSRAETGWQSCTFAGSSRTGGREIQKPHCHLAAQRARCVGQERRLQPFCAPPLATGSSGRGAGMKIFA